MTIFATIIDAQMTGKTFNIQTDCSRCSKVTESPMLHYFLPKGYHYPESKCTQNCMIFLLKGVLLVNSNEYAGTTLRDGEFILQAIGSKLELLALTDCECIVYQFKEPVFICEERYKRIIENAIPPLIYSPLKMVPALNLFLNGVVMFNKDGLKCQEFFVIKQKELSFILNSYYTERELYSLFHPISSYTNSFQYFVMQNYTKVRTVEELAHLGGYSITTFRRMFRNLFKEPAYEWMLQKKREGVLEDLIHTNLTISAISQKYGFEALSHFSNFCKTYFGSSPRELRKKMRST